MNICYLFICLFYLFPCLAAPDLSCGTQDLCCSMWNLASQTPCMGAQSLSHGTTREVPIYYFSDQSSMLPFGNNPTFSPEFEL